MNKIIYILLTIITFSCISINVNAEGTITTRGSRSCGVWIEQRKSNEEFELGKSSSWFVGYLTGLAVNSRKDFLKNTDNKSMFLWLDNYCRTNPLDDMAITGVFLSDELKKQKGLQ